MFFFFFAFQPDCFNLLWDDLEKINEAVKQRTPREGDEASTGGPRAKRIRTVERYEWEIKKKGAIVRKSDHVFLTMQQCMADVSDIKLTSGEVVGYACNNFLFEKNSDIISKVFLYLFKQDYCMVCFFKCGGCQNKTQDHEDFCLKSDKFTFSSTISIYCQEKISPVRLARATNIVKGLFGIYDYFSLEDINDFLNTVDSLDLSEIQREMFEREFNILDVEKILP